SVSQSGSATTNVASSAAAASSEDNTQAPVQRQSAEKNSEANADAKASTASSPSSPEHSPSANRPSPTAALPESSSSRNLPHASPSVRKFARELGVDLTKVTRTGAKQRITQDDVRQFVKQALAGGSTVAPAQAATGNGLSVLPWPKVDFTTFGSIESRPLSRI